MAKRHVTKTLEISGTTALSQFWQRLYYQSNYIRAVLYHDTLPNNRDTFESHLQYFREHFTPVGLAHLDLFFEGKWDFDRPGIIICFDDGLRSNYEIAMSLLKKYDLIGWFMIPAGLIEPATEEARAKHARFAADHPSYNDNPRVFMSWDEIRDLQEPHVIGCHTMTHFRLNDSHDEGRLHQEIIAAKQLLETRLEREISVFAWVGGEPYNRGRRPAEMVRQAGFRYAFLTHMAPIIADTNSFLLQRTGLEDSYSLATVKYYLSGLSDKLATRERKKTNTIIFGDSG